MKPVVNINDLKITYHLEKSNVYAVNHVSLEIFPGEIVGIVGESGSGKSTLGLAIGRLLSPNAVYENGSIKLDGKSVLACDHQTLRKIRRDKLGFVLQNPMTALDPTMRIQRQLQLVLKKKISQSAIEALIAQVGIDEPGRVARSFPHELSGGMAQRVVIALAIARNPTLLIADEPTASLDASIQEHILKLLQSIRNKLGVSIIILSHDLRLVANHCDRMLVMYGGELMELGKSSSIFRMPRHPYTDALIKAAPGNEGPDGELKPIPGIPPILREKHSGCIFAERCAFTQQSCLITRPEIRKIGDRLVACSYADSSTDILSP